MVVGPEEHLTHQEHRAGDQGDRQGDGRDGDQPLTVGVHLGLHHWEGLLAEECC